MSAILLAACGGSASQSTTPAAAPAPAQGAEAPAATTPAPVAVTPTPAAAARPAAPKVDRSCLTSLDFAAHPELALDCVLVVEGWRDLLDEIGTGWREQSVSRIKAFVPAETTAKVEAAFQEHASAEALYAGLRTRLSADEAAMGVSETLAWYRTPLGMKELAAAAGSATPDLDGIAAWKKASKPKGKRRKLLEEYYRHSNAEALLHAMVVVPAVSLSRATVEGTPEAASFDAAAMDAKFEPLVAEAMKPVRDAEAYALRDFSDAELVELNAHLAKPETKRSDELILKALEATVAEAARPVGPPLRLAMEQLVARMNSMVEQAEADSDSTEDNGEGF